MWSTRKAWSGFPLYCATAAQSSSEPLGLNFKHQNKNPACVSRSSLFSSRRIPMRDSSYLQLWSWKSAAGCTTWAVKTNEKSQMINNQKVPVYFITDWCWIGSLRLVSFLWDTRICVPFGGVNLAPGVLQQVPHQEQKHHDISCWHYIWI